MSVKDYHYIHSGFNHAWECAVCLWDALPGTPDTNFALLDDSGQENIDIAIQPNQMTLIAHY